MEKWCCRGSRRVKIRFVEGREGYLLEKISERKNFEKCKIEDRVVEGREGQKYGL